MQGFLILLLPMIASVTVLILLHVAAVPADDENVARMMFAAKSFLVVSLLGTAVAIVVFSRSVVRRIRIIEQTARCLRLEQPLVRAPLGDDELGRVEKQLELTSDFLFHRLKNLRESEEHLHAILDHATAVVYVKDFEGRYLFANRHCTELFGIRLKKEQSLTDAQVFPQQIASKLRENDLRVLELGRSMQFEELAPHADGLHTYLSVKFPLLDSNNKPYAVAGISTDISERKRLERALRDASEEISKRSDPGSWGGSPPVDFGSPPAGWIARMAPVCHPGARELATVG